jgi:alpha-beta hydrolase superfamily lysophospholipase
MNEQIFEGSGGVTLFARWWRPEGRARAVIVLVHGLKAHSGMFNGAARELVQHGYAVYALDLRGHGRSGGERLYVDRFADYVADLDRFVELARSREPGVPLFVLGHSAGGVVSSAYTLEHQDRLAGFICESFAQEVPAPNALLAVVKGISRLAPHVGVFDLKEDDFSRDPAFVERMKTDPLIPRIRYPSQTVAEIRRAEQYLEKSFSNITLPVLILHGTLDKVTKPHGSQLFYDMAGSTDKTLRLYEGHFHDLLNDVGKEHVMGEITEWIDAHVSR